MASMGIDGIVSGLDTTALINSLMQVEAMPQTLLKSKVSTTQSFISALQGLNTKVASLGDAAKAAAKAESWGAATASSSAKSVTATAKAGAGVSSLSFTVDQLATGQTSLSPKIASLAKLFATSEQPDGAVPASVTLKSGAAGAEKYTTVSLTDVKDLAGFAAALNKSDAGVTATVVTVSPTESRLQITSKATGTPAAFDLYSGTVTAETTSPTAVMSRADALTKPTDAQITLWAGKTGFEEKVTSATNTFSGVLTGVDLTVTAQEKDPVTVTVVRDDAALKKLASNLVGALGVVFSEVKSRTAASTTTSADGRTVISGGVLSGDSATRGVNQKVLAAASQPVDGISPSEVGMVLGRDGTITFDDAKFTAAMAADPNRVQAVVMGVAARVADAAKEIADPIDGSLSLKVKSQETFSKNLSQQVSDWDRRLEVRRAGLQATYTAMEVGLSGLQAQGSWLSGQISALMANNR
ncbi:flagellar filament capping protein FliD [Cellulomonas sp. ATA003]|uniref:flagellar filament capping protein FliD n=1 Tax=Cellulomonas sp. ATA003 TaxID=3073064 RepID=UPI0028732332|nr:flagellar filament capping protein FliD [Cellulomonas sp. ATA003]WNB85249.1 flagellar filament capping protein FliD [Cellulomonas sp. ATA003]